MTGFGGMVAIAALHSDGTPTGHRWPATQRRAALLWLGNLPRRSRIRLAYVPAESAQERFADVSSREIWAVSPTQQYGGLRLCDVG